MEELKQRAQAVILRGVEWWEKSEIVSTEAALIEVELKAEESRAVALAESEGELGRLPGPYLLEAQGLSRAFMPVARLWFLVARWEETAPMWLVGSLTK